MFKFLKSNKKTLAIAAIVGSSLVMNEAAFAGAGGTEFDPIWDTITEWIQGTLGKVIAGSFILVGLIAGVVRQSIMSFAIGVGAGIGLFNSPTIIEAMMTATLPVSEAATKALQLSNGLGL